MGQIYQLAGPTAFTWDEAIARLADIRSLPVLEVKVEGFQRFMNFLLKKQSVI